MRDDAIGYLLKAASGAPACADVAAWWAQYRDAVRTWRNPMDRAIAAGFGADRTAWAFASGYQAALHALFPAIPEDRICAFCVTEAEGNAPRAIRSTLQRTTVGWRLDGTKRWATLGPESALFLVAARDEAASGERVALRVARVSSDAAGVRIERMPESRFVPEVPHAQIRFEDVRLAEDALLPGDGYEEYVKLFRTVEDLHVHAAVLAYLVREARRLAWPGEWIERAAAVLHGLRALAAEDAAAPATHVALAGALAIGARLIADADAHWAARTDEPAAPRWQRDRALLGVAGEARARRQARAWEQLRPTSPAA